MDVLLASFQKSKQIKKGKESIPVASLYLSAYLNNGGVKCELIDFSVLLPPIDNIDVEDFFVDRLIAKFSPPPRILGFNCFSSYQFSWIINLSERMKSLFPGVSICVGGSHPTFFAQEILNNCKSIDYVFVGEGEEHLLTLAKILLGTSSEKISNIQAIGFRDENGNVIINPRKNYLRNLNIEPKELWGALKFENYYSDHTFWNNPKNLDIQLAVPIISSRSCPFKCSFCSTSKIMGPALRCRDPKNVLDEIEYLNKERGQNYFEFVDDNINVNRNHAMQIFSGIKERGLDIQFSMSNGIHLASADEELIRLMAEAGLAMIKLPIEHGNDYIRNQIIGKKLLREDIFRIANVLRQYDVFIFGLLIMGFPEDTAQTLDDSFDLMCELKLDIYEMASLIPFPGTRLFEQCMRDHLLISDLPYQDLWKGIIGFDASQHDKIYLKPYQMTLELLQEYRKKFDDIRLFSAKAKRM